MDSDKMVRQANQIAQYFSAYPQERAEEGVHGHIRKFWEPRMRAQLIEHYDNGGDGMHPLVSNAAALIKAETQAG